MIKKQGIWNRRRNKLAELKEAFKNKFHFIFKANVLSLTTLTSSLKENISLKKKNEREFVSSETVWDDSVEERARSWQETWTEWTKWGR